MRKTLIAILFFLVGFVAEARHIAGGEMFYEYLGPGTGFNTSLYHFTLRLFRDCQSSGPLLQNENVNLGIYEGGSLRESLKLNIDNGVSTIQLNTSTFPCLTGAPVVCYEVATYSNTLELPNSINGYTLSRIGCCRVDGITNIGGSRNVGSNYVTTIPGTITLPEGHNNSPQFYIRDTALICTQKSFMLDFGALDPDGDSLTYTFCDAYGASSGSSNAPPPNSISLSPLNYSSPFSGSSPLGSTVTINQGTGVISGVAPSAGYYVVNVCVTEWRNGRPFSEHRKDFIMQVQDCDLIEAQLPDKIIQCDSLSVFFQNQSSASGITSYKWDFGEPSSSSNLSTSATLFHKYADTGRYLAKLTVTGPRGCVGMDSTIVLVYPGFFPKMSVVGSCVTNPYTFKDLSTTKYGFISARLWDFGDETTITDTSSLAIATYKYGSPAVRTVQMIVESSKGCFAVIQQPINVRLDPVLQLAFKDTLICSIDTLALGVEGGGTFSWLPNKDILYADSSHPLVFPKTTSTYYVTVNDNGCKGTDSVKVNVLSFINVSLGPDSSICKTDTFHLRASTQGLGFQWIANTGESVSPIRSPLVQPLKNTQYNVIANLGKCTATDSIFIRVAPYPVALTAPDTSICTGFKVQLNAAIVGSSFKWSPTNSLINPTTLHPIAGPSKTTAYILTVSDTIGCVKSVSDTLLVTLVPTIKAFAGRDTTIALDQPLQLNATGGTSYLWSPITGLSDPTIANPIATLSDDIDSIKYIVKVIGEAGCFNTDDIKVKVFKTGPEIFVPSAFTPNADNKNDVLKPITVGIEKLHYFSIYSRWGQLLFTTTEIGKGWDGIYNGTKQPSGTYVYSTEGVDFMGKIVFRKGTTVLIR
jgi:gliding motility-associated-like protein